MYDMHRPSTASLGRWILDAEPLLKAGLAWYLPSYSTSKQEIRSVGDEMLDMPHQVKAVDYLIGDGRAIDASDAEPIKRQLVRPILSIELPFIEGVKPQGF